MNEGALFRFNEFEVIHKTICIIGAYAINNSFLPNYRCLAPKLFNEELKNKYLGVAKSE
jgi:hypothetical protein